MTNYHKYTTPAATVIQFEVEHTIMQGSSTIEEIGPRAEDKEW